MAESSLVAIGDAPVFNFGAHPVRVVLRDGEPWFVASDVAEVLGYRDAHNAGRQLSEHQKGTHNLSTPGGDQRVTIISESGLYRLVLRSRKPEAEKFSDWVTGEVLPSIRKTGSYRSTDAARYELAQKIAAKAAAGVVEAVVNAVMSGDGELWRYSTYVLHLAHGSEGGKPSQPFVRALDMGEMVISLNDLPERIAGRDPVAATDVQLAKLGQAVAARQLRNAERSAGVNTTAAERTVYMSQNGRLVPVGKAPD